MANPKTCPVVQAGFVISNKVSTWHESRTRFFFGQDNRPAPKVKSCGEPSATGSRSSRFLGQD